MEYLHASSFPVSKSELELFSIPPTQTAIESSYEVEYRPNSSLENGTSFEIHIPSSDDFTDLQATMLHLVVSVTTEDKKAIGEVNAVKPVANFANALFEQIDLFLGSVNTSPANNMYHYQAWLEDELFRYPTKADSGRMDTVDENRIKESKFDLFFRLHLPLCEQDKLMINAIPISFRFTKSPDGFALIKTDEINYKININYVSLHVKRVKLFPDAALSIAKGLKKSPAKYFITRNETRSFSIGANLSAVAVENVFSGILPRRIVIGFVNESAFSGSVKEDPYKFNHFNISYITLSVDGNNIPSILYTPNFTEGLCMREFVDLYRYMNQDEGEPQMQITYEEFKTTKTLFAFDLTPDGSLGAESGTLSLLRRGIIRLQAKFTSALTKPIKAIVFAQFDNLITIDENRSVTLDY